ncbi:hypothetical protein P691DRAFT_790763 [Macrolepiota fuliginosa MF-IS2]|uniref:Uncharacterized protein n=1 Tax=Macrolepiota fuliginosa MF-IS2 TaxID=1400762 RepID=A0A9P5XGX1_9AGAR|nr:hypothetical protein P691DRAFT_790763 [Macrolepiota fuliginosa MF-IS2]
MASIFQSLPPTPLKHIWYSTQVIKPNLPASPENGPAPHHILNYIPLLPLPLYICCYNTRQKNTALTGNPPASVAMVLPAPNSGKKEKDEQGRKPKKGGGGQAGGSVQLTLIVDPHVPTRRRDDMEDDVEASGGGVPRGFYGVGSSGSARGTKSRGRRNPRQWKLANAQREKIVVVDAPRATLLLVLIFIGMKCLSDGFKGYVSLARSYPPRVALAAHVFFDVKDLHTSKASPRT